MPVAPAPILALDLGSTSVKAARYTTEGVRVGAIAEVRHRSNAGALLDCARVLRAVLAILAEISGEGVRVISTTTMWQSLVLIDHEGRANPWAATWETPQPAEVISIARTRLAQVWDAHATGAYVHAGYPLLAAAAGTVTARDATRLSDIGGWVIETLTGTRVGWSEAIASGSGMWDRRARTWHTAITKRCGLQAQLFADDLFTEPVRSTRPHPLLPAALRDAMWLPPLPDGLCHNLGVGAVGDTVTATVGTSGSIRAVGSDVLSTAPQGLWAYRCGERTLAVGGAVSSAGNLIEWLERFTGMPFDSASFTTDEPVLPSLTTVPDVFGRRGPDYPIDATGAVVGLRPEHTLYDVAKAFAIDVWSSFARLFALYDDAHPVAAIRAGGGVIERHAVSAQLLADAVGRAVEVPAVAQPALRGAALFGSVAMDSSSDPPNVDDVVVGILSGDLPTPAPLRIVEPRSAWTSALRARWQTDAGAR